MSDPMSERELGEIRIDAESEFPISPDDGLRLLAEIDRLRASRELMLTAAEKIEGYSIKPIWNDKLLCGQCDELFEPNAVEYSHKPECLIARLRTAGEG